MKIFPPTKVYISESPLHGFGVFAKEPIEANEVIEETPLLDLGINVGEWSTLFSDYRFDWPTGAGQNWEKQVLPWGYGCIYNHSDTPNAYWRSHKGRGTFEFVARRRIERDEEICTFYGGPEYWQQLGITPR